MEIQKYLFDWDHPLTQCIEFGMNIKFIHAYTPVTHQFVGYAGSGGLFLGAMAAHDHGSNHEYVHLRKPTDNTSTLRYSKITLSDKPIIIIDDHIYSLDTMKQIAKQIAEQNKIENVVGVIARCFDCDLPENNKKRFEEMPKKLGELFPNLQYWMCQKD